MENDSRLSRGIDGLLERKKLREKLREEDERVRGFYISVDTGRETFVTGLMRKIPKETKKNMKGILFKGIDINENGIRDSIERIRDGQVESGVKSYQIDVYGEINLEILQKSGTIEEVQVLGMKFKFDIFTNEKPFIKARDEYKKGLTEQNRFQRRELTSRYDILTKQGELMGRNNIDFREQDKIRRRLESHTMESYQTMQRYVTREVYKKRDELETVLKSRLDGYYGETGLPLIQGIGETLMFITSNDKLFEDKYLEERTKGYRKIKPTDTIEGMISNKLLESVEKVVIVGRDFEIYKEHIKREGWLKIDNIPVFVYQLDSETDIYFGATFGYLYNTRDKGRENGEHIVPLFDLTTRSNLYDVKRVIEDFRIEKESEILYSIYREHFS